MKVLYFGTVCDIHSYNKRVEQCSYKPSVAPILFETALLNGFKENGMNIDILSFPMLPTFPAGKELFFGGNTEQLSCGYSCCWLRTINLPFLKQISRRLDARRLLKKWLKENAEDGIIFTYSIPPFLVKDIFRYAEKYKVKTVAIIPDLLRDMYINENQTSFITKIKNRSLSTALELQGEYDGYVYLTEAMCEVVAPLKPCIVMEGIADVSDVAEPVVSEKSLPRAVMYAGMLHEKYGVINLLDAFEMMNAENAELWLFGEGTAVPEIMKRSAINKKIRYFGSVTHDEIISFERKATLLVNPRSVDDEFTKYSFPSKTIEYMLSGTPVLTTKLQGIPEEYFEYVFSVSGNTPDVLARKIENIMNCSAEELCNFGKRAQRFIKEEKNARRQSAKISDFLGEVKYDIQD